MHFFAVALVTDDRRSTGKGKNRSDLVSNVTMAICAFDLVVRDMVLMNELGGILGAQYSRFIVALYTFPLRDMGVSLNNIDMTLLTGHSPGDILSVIETPTFDLNVPFGLNVARGATAYSARNAFLFTS
jgi:hypothetical protein